MLSVRSGQLYGGGSRVLMCGDIGTGNRQQARPGAQLAQADVLLQQRESQLALEERTALTRTQRRQATASLPLPFSPPYK